MYERLSRYPKGTILIVGGAIGGDHMAARIGYELGFKVHEYLYFADKGLGGGHARNRCMFDVLLTQRHHGFDCYVEAFPKGKSSGTRGTIDHVKTYNKDTRTKKKMPLEETEG